MTVESSSDLAQRKIEVNRCGPHDELAISRLDEACNPEARRQYMFGMREFIGSSALVGALVLNPDPMGNWVTEPLEAVPRARQQTVDEILARLGGEYAGLGERLLTRSAHSEREAASANHPQPIADCLSQRTSV